MSYTIQEYEFMPVLGEDIEEKFAVLANPQYHLPLTRVVNDKGVEVLVGIFNLHREPIVH